MNIENTEVVAMLKTAGWYPGREVFNELTLPDGFEVFPKAKEILQEFGGLIIGQYGKGIDWARSRVAISPPDLYLEFPVVVAFMGHFEMRLFPIGEIVNSWPIIVDEKGLTYLLVEGPTIGASQMVPYGQFDQALEMLLLGIKPSLPPVILEK